MTLAELQARVGVWQRRVFVTLTIEQRLDDLCTKLAEEAAEFLSEPELELKDKEAADLVIVALGWADMRGIDLNELVISKMDRNESARYYTTPEGHIRRVKNG